MAVFEPIISSHWIQTRIQLHEGTVLSILVIIKRLSPHFYSAVLQAKRFLEAIDVCHKVLKLSADYPKIRKEILEKSMAGLRP